MKKEKIYLVEYLYHGLLFSDSERKKIKDPDPHKIKKNGNAYGFNLLEQEIVTDGDNTYESKAKYLDGQYFFEGTVYTADEVAKLFPKEEILISNMRGNKIDKVIRVHERFYPFDKKGVLLG